ncbi:MAG: hypothetical protein NTX50_26130 [Candidatus Sumerlaeota bacterium]|nr:hypothetical protein [Candidatus Sumerlaeota bacterium]
MACPKIMACCALRFTFRDFLLDRNFTIAVRYSNGLEARAACGQLALS